MQYTRTGLRPSTRWGDFPEERGRRTEVGTAGGGVWQMHMPRANILFTDMFDRRSFLKAGAAGVSGAAALLQSSAQAQPKALNASPRHVLPLNRNWLYGGRATSGCAAADFDDSKFQHVTIPHSNRTLPWHSF